MNDFFVTYHTDVGNKKKINQDSILMKGITNGQMEVVLVVVCDGMGGMLKGELASAAVVRKFSDWFEEIYTQRGTAWDADEIEEQWNRLLREINDRLICYGEKEQIQLGTTATAALISSDGNYLIAHVGDTRAYRISEKMTQLTEDHTFLARELKRGNMTLEQARTDARKNVLLQCMGVNQFFTPQYVTGMLKKGEAMLLCSDGFRHEVSDEEIQKYLNP